MSDATTRTSETAFRRAARDAPAGARVPVVVTVRAAPFEAYRRARGDDPSFLFETTGGRSGWGYFGVSPDRFRAVDGAGAVSTLADAVADETLVRGDCSIPFPGGWFGWLSYDAVRELEDLPDATEDDRGLPRLQVGRYPTVAAWEEPHDGPTTLAVVSAPRVEGDPAAAYDRGLARARSLADRALTGDPSVGDPPVRADGVSFTSDCGRAEYRERVRRVKREIREGETFQANISHRLSAPAAVHPVAAYDALRSVNPAPYSGLVEFPGVDLVSASPELLLEREGRRLLTEPIAGTRPRGDSPAEDERLERDLTGDEKERAEHAMLVDLERNDLGKVSEYGSVTVDEYRRVDRYSAVMHLVSLVSGTLRSDCDLADAVGAVFPGGTITGAPKPRTMAIIDAVEDRRRGPYTGSMAAVGFDGRAALNIVIRTLVRHGDAYHLRVGGGVVHDSDPDREYEETLAKASALITAVDEALGERADWEVARE